MEGFGLALAAHVRLMLFDAPHGSNSLEITYKHTRTIVSVTTHSSCANICHPRCGPY